MTIHSLPEAVISLPDKGINIKYYGARDAIEKYRGLYSVKKMIVYSYFIALHGSALIIHRLAAEFPDIEFVVFVMDSTIAYIGPFLVDLPKNVKVYLANIYKENRKPVYGKMIVSAASSSRKSLVEYVDHSENHETARYDSLCDFHYGGRSEVSMKFGFAFDHPLFRLKMVDYFVNEFAIDFSNISYVRVVAGSGLMSLLIAQALKKLGADITLQLVQVGRKFDVSRHKKYFPTDVIECPGYNSPFNYDTLSDGDRSALAELPYGYDTYCGKVFIEGIRANTLFVIIRNGI